MASTTILLSYITDWKFLFSFAVVYALSVVVRRIWFHPLSHVPGPKLAAVTHWYHSYWHAIKKGHFVPYVLPDLHKKYGPVVRFSPTEVDVHDVEVYQTVFAHKSKFHKDRVFFDAFGAPRSSGMLKDIGEWRERRIMLNPMFSKRAINDLTSRLIYPMVEKLCRHLDNFCDTQTPVPFDNATYCVTVDIITAYVSGTPWNMLDEPGFDTERLDSVRWFTGGSNVAICFPWTRRAVQFLNWCFPAIVLEGYTQMFRAAQNFVAEAVVADAKAKSSGTWKEGQKPKYVYDAMLNPDPSKGLKRLTFDDLVDETMLVIAGGGDTSANMIQFAVWRLCQDSDIKRRVVEEIKTVPRDDEGRFDCQKLEELPYLTAFIKEMMRFYHGAIGRQPRVVPEGGLLVKSCGIFLPAGTRISCNVVNYHMDPSIFDKPHKFRPERWFGEAGKTLEKWLLSFGKGDRLCLGINLGYRELYLVLAELLSRYDITTWRTTDEDMKMVDHLAVAPQGRMKVMLQKRQA